MCLQIDFTIYLINIFPITWGSCKVSFTYIKTIFFVKILISVLGQGTAPNKQLKNVKNISRNLWNVDLFHRITTQLEPSFWKSRRFFVEGQRGRGWENFRKGGLKNGGGFLKRASWQILGSIAFISTICCFPTSWMGIISSKCLGLL